MTQNGLLPDASPGPGMRCHRVALAIALCLYLCSASAWSSAIRARTSALSRSRVRAGAAPPKRWRAGRRVTRRPRVQEGRLRRGSSVLRGKACAAPKRPHVMDQVPNVLVGLDPAKRGHPAQPNTVFYNPEQFAIGGPLHLGPGEIRGVRVHPPPGVRGRVAVGAVTHRAVVA